MGEGRDEDKYQGWQQDEQQPRENRLWAEAGSPVVILWRNCRCVTGEGLLRSG